MLGGPVKETLSTRCPLGFRPLAAQLIDQTGTGVSAIALPSLI